MATTDMKITRSIPALEKTIGTVASFDQHKAIVREDMKRILTPEERQNYRGITSNGHPWLSLDELFHVETTEDVLKAQEGGFYHTPADCPGEHYLFACEAGLVARAHPNLVAKLRAPSDETKAHGEQEGEYQGSDKTRDELHAEYKGAELQSKNWDEIFDEIAGAYVKWACGKD
ncbi:hypothetical protein E4U21_005147 [Claviceps maximensis]|nr:hypothetical protein E4U21_005147 [Claviceps maximensis]